MGAQPSGRRGPSLAKKLSVKTSGTTVRLGGKKPPGGAKGGKN